MTPSTADPIAISITSTKTSALPLAFIESLTLVLLHRDSVDQRGVGVFRADVSELEDRCRLGRVDGVGFRGPPLTRQIDGIQLRAIPPDFDRIVRSLGPW